MSREFCIFLTATGFMYCQVPDPTRRATRRPWRNGSASDFESGGCGFESRRACFFASPGGSSPSGVAAFLLGGAGSSPSALL